MQLLLQSSLCEVRGIHIKESFPLGAEGSAKAFSVGLISPNCCGIGWRQRRHRCAVQQQGFGVSSRVSGSAWLLNIQQRACNYLCIYDYYHYYTHTHTFVLSCLGFKTLRKKWVYSNSTCNLLFIYWQNEHSNNNSGMVEPCDPAQRVAFLCKKHFLELLWIGP